MSEYLTVVLKIDDDEAAKIEIDALMDKFKRGDCLDGYSIVAAGRDHEIYRLELIEKALEQGPIYAAEEISNILSKTKLISE